MDRKRKLDSTFIDDNDAELKKAPLQVDQPSCSKCVQEDYWVECEDDIFMNIDISQILKATAGVACSTSLNYSANVSRALTIVATPATAKCVNVVQLPDYIRCKEGTQSYAWLSILDHLGPVSEWGPMRNQYRKAFWSVSLGYKDRLLVGSFCYQNGVTIDIACDFFQLRGINKFHIYKTKQLYAYWNHETEGFERRERYFAYEIYQRCFANLNGVPRKGQEKYSML